MPRQCETMCLQHAVVANDIWHIYCSSSRQGMLWVLPRLCGNGCQQALLCVLSDINRFSSYNSQAIVPVLQVIVSAAA